MLGSFSRLSGNSTSRLKLVRIQRAGREPGKPTLVSKVWGTGKYGFHFLLGFELPWYWPKRSRVK
jgi:hypothetical protein